MATVKGMPWYTQPPYSATLTAAQSFLSASPCMLNLTINYTRSSYHKFQSTGRHEVLLYNLFGDVHNILSTLFYLKLLKYSYFIPA